MKLYYAPATCSLAPHIALREAGLDFTLVRYDMKEGRFDNGQPMEQVNEKGYVPVLELPGGERLTEVTAILLYIADQVPARGLAPPAGTMARYRLQEWLNFIATELHKIFWPLFHDGAEIENQHAREKLTRRFAWVEQKLAEDGFLMAGGFTVADAYLATVVNWTRAAALDLNAWPRLKAYRTQMRARPAVAAAMEAEGLLKRGG